MPNFLRFRNQGHKPKVGSDQVGFYSDSDGVLQTVDVDGNVVPVGTGEQGEPGTPVWQGDWSAGSYDAGEAVAHDGSSYVANTATSDEPPSGDWDLLAAKGEDGEGGSQTFKCVRFPFTFALQTAGEAGLPIYVPVARDWWGFVTVSCTVAFDGTNPTVNGFIQGDDYTSQAIFNDNGISSVDGPNSTGASMSTPNDIIYTVVQSFFDDATPLMLNLVDNLGANPGCSQGEGEVLLFIAPAS
jgi:hypothetical protein